MTGKIERIGLISTGVANVLGGGRFIVEWLEEKLREKGHEVETIFIPSYDHPNTLLDQMHAFTLIELDSYFDRVITFRPPSHMVRHRKKICWFIHHVRYLYDLWDEPTYNPVPHTAAGIALRDTVRAVDTSALTQAYRLFTNSQTVANRLKAYNQLESSVLYPPVFRPDLFYDAGQGDEVVCVCRVEHHKRQHLLVEAMAHTRTTVRLRLSGVAQSPEYLRQLRNLASASGAENRIFIENRWISEEEKADQLARSLAAAYVPLDEDSYGYPTIEAAHAGRPVLALSDGGGVREFVIDGINGRIVDPDPVAIAEALDGFYLDKARTKKMGLAANQRIRELRIDWDHVVEQLLA